jgi:hypothetical protein
MPATRSSAAKTSQPSNSVSSKGRRKASTKDDDETKQTQTKNKTEKASKRITKSNGSSSTKEETTAMEIDEPEMSTKVATPKKRSIRATTDSHDSTTEKESNTLLSTKNDSLSPTNNPPPKRIRTSALQSTTSSTGSSRAAQMSEIARQTEQTQTTKSSAKATAKSSSKAKKEFIQVETKPIDTEEFRSKAQTTITTKTELQKSGKPHQTASKNSNQNSILSLANAASSSSTITTSLAQGSTNDQLKDRLPPSFKELEEIFNCVEVACGFLEGRRQICSFEKLQEAVSTMGRRSLNQRHLGKIKTVFPEAFQFKILKQSLILLRAPATTFSSGEQMDQFTSIISSEIETQRRRKEFHDRLVHLANTKNKKKTNQKKSVKAEAEEDEDGIEVAELPKPQVIEDDDKRTAKKELLQKLLEVRH